MTAVGMAGVGVAPSWWALMTMRRDGMEEKEEMPGSWNLEWDVGTDKSVVWMGFGSTLMKWHARSSLIHYLP